MNSWQTAPLGELCDVAAGGTPSRTNPAYFGGGVPWVKIGDMLQGEVTSTEETISQVGLSNSSAKLLPSGTVIISIFATIGRTAVLRLNAATNQAIAGLTPRDPNKLMPEYLRLFLDAAVKELERRARGVAQANINLGILSALQVPLPPLGEQRNIAAVLDKVDVLRAKRREALAQLDESTQSIFLDMFGDPSKNPRKWPRLCLGEAIEHGPQNGLYKPSIAYGSGTPILRIDGFYDGTIIKLGSLKRLQISDYELRLYELLPGDIVINRVNSIQYLGKSAIVPELVEPVVFESNMMRLRVHRNLASPSYVVKFLQSDFVRSQVLRSAKRAVNQASINQRDVKGIQINIPPLNLQHQFARRIEQVERIKICHRAHLTELGSLFASLQDRAFRGEL